MCICEINTFCFVFFESLVGIFGLFFKIILEVFLDVGQVFLRAWFTFFFWRENWWIGKVDKLISAHLACFPGSQNRYKKKKVGTGGVHWIFHKWLRNYVNTWKNTYMQRIVFLESSRNMRTAKMAFQTKYESN